MYLLKEINRKTEKNYIVFFVGVLKVKDVNSRIRRRIHWSEARIRGSGSAPKCHGFTTLVPRHKSNQTRGCDQDYV